MIVAVLLFAGCGSGSPPTISDLTLAATTVAPGGQLSGQLKVADPDGMEGLKLSLQLAGSGLAQPEQTVGVANTSSSITEALVPFVLLIAAQAPAGSYTLAVAAIDGDGDRSNELKSSFEVR